MRAKRSDLRSLIMIFNKLKSASGINIKTASILYKNSKAIEEELSFIASELPKIVSEETRQFEEKKEELMRLYCNKDSSGNPIITNDGYMFSNENMRKLTEEIEKYLREIGEEKATKINMELEEIKNFTEEEVDIDLEKFDASKLPENVLNYTDISLLISFGLLDPDAI